MSQKNTQCMLKRILFCIADPTQPQSFHRQSSVPIATQTQQQLHSSLQHTQSYDINKTNKETQGMYMHNWRGQWKKGINHILIKIEICGISYRLANDKPIYKISQKWVVYFSSYEAFS